ncbi:MAG: hypothetical protein LUE99_08360 [Bacteroides sp.]|nr:hypothetical protein [Bacteroides sp.]
MNRITLALKRPFIWLCRFRHRCGYGVHSPFAFNLITNVIYEKMPYYKYKDLTLEQKRLASQKERHWNYESKKVKQLLFRLVNYAQPDTIVDVGTLAASSLYLKAGREKADYTSATDLSELFLENGVPVGFLYLHDYRHPEFMEEVFRICAARTTDQSVFVIEGIRYTSRMRAIWKRMQQNERAGITFDLYELGIIFFDKTKIKQDYIINF